MLKVSLPEAAENYNLVELGHFRVHVEQSESVITTTTNSIEFNSVDAGTVVKIIGGGNFLQSDMTTVIPGTEVTITADNYIVYLSNGNYELDISNKYTITKCYLGSNLFIDSEQNGTFSKMESFKTNNVKSTLSISSFKGSGPIAVIDAENSGVSGNVDVFENKQYLLNLNFHNCEGVVGDISAFANCESLQGLNVENSGIEGSIEDLGKCIALTNLNISGTDIGGTLNNLAAAMAANGRTSGTLYFKSKTGSWSSVSFPYNP